MDRPERAEERLRLAFGWIVLVAWAVSFVLDVVVVTYDPPAGLQPLALAVAGYLFAIPVARGMLDRRRGD